MARLRRAPAANLGRPGARTGPCCSSWQSGELESLVTGDSHVGVGSDARTKGRKRGAERWPHTR